MNEAFRKFAATVSRAVGSFPVFLFAVGMIALSGWYFGFSATWERYATFGMVIATFLMIFFLQNSQNVGEKATHLKLDELIRAIEGARNEVVSIEQKEEREIDVLKQAMIEADEEGQATRRV